MTEEQIKAKAKEQFPNDEFKQQIVIDAINWATKELEKENAELKRDKEDLIFIRNQNAKCMCEDKEQLTKAKELLGHIVKYYRDDEDLGLAKEINEAEQFLSEVEK